MEILTFSIDSIDDKDIRIDKYLSTRCENLSRARIQKLIEDSKVLVNKNPVKVNYKTKLNDSIELSIDDPIELDVEPENIPIDIVYEDEDLIIVNKPKGMVVHPAAGHYSGTLVNALLYHCKDNLSSINGIMRPGIVHRIDMDTTGLLVVCKNDNSHQLISKQLSVHSITRKYYAIVYGCFNDNNGTIDAPIGRHNTDRKKMAINKLHGKEAITHYRVLETFSNKYSFIECQLETGRTHQIRVHMSSINHPLVGDTVYGPKTPLYSYLQGQTLHAGVLGFIHPRTGEYIEFSAPLPEYFNDLLTKMRNMN